MRYKKLGDLVNILSGFAFDSNYFNSENGLLLVRIRDVIRGFSSTYYSGEYDEKFIVENGDVLIGMDGEFNIAQWKGGKALLNQRVCKVIPVSQEIDSKYLFRFLPKELKLIEDTTSFVTVKHLSVKKLQEIEIPLPPLAEQKRIAEVLDKADALREKRRRALQKLNTLLQSVFLEMFGDPVKNPKGWKSVSLGDVLSLITYGLTVRPKYVEDGFHLISAKEIREGFVDFDSANKISKDSFEKVSDKGKPKKNDILFSKTGSIGHCAMVETDMPFAISQNAARLTFNPKLTLPNFALNFLRLNKIQDLAKSYSKGNAVKDLQLGDMKRLPFYLPPLEMQEKFRKFAERQEGFRKQIEESSYKIENLFQSLQQKAFNGELFNGDSADELNDEKKVWQQTSLF